MRDLESRDVETAARLAAAEALPEDRERPSPAELAEDELVQSQLEPAHSQRVPVQSQDVTVQSEREPAQSEDVPEEDIPF